MKEINLENIDNLFLDFSGKINQSLNTTDSVKFNDVEVANNVTIEQDLNVTGLIRGNVVDTSNTGISISQPSIGFFPSSSISNITQLFSTLKIFSATYATLNFTMNFTTIGNNTSPTRKIFFDMSVPGIPTFTSQNRENYTFFADIYQTNTQAKLNEVYSEPIINTKQIRVYVLVNDTSDTYIFNGKMSYSFIQSPTLFNFTYSDYTSGIVSSSQLQYVSFLLVSLNTNVIDLNLSFTCTTDNQIESFEILLPNRIDDFTNNNQVYSIANAIHRESNQLLDNVNVVSVINKKTCKVSFISVIGTIFINLQLDYRNTN